MPVPFDLASTDRGPRPPVHTRPLTPGDADRLGAHLVRLDADARRLRFGGFMSDASLIRYAERTLAEAVVVVGLFEAGELRGAAELHKVVGDAVSAEAAFSLENDVRGAGHGTRLLASLERRARRAGLRRIVLQCLAENRAMLRLARRAGAALRFEGGEVVATLPLEAAVPPAARPASSLRSASRCAVEALRRDAQAGEPALG